MHKCQAHFPHETYYSLKQMLALYSIIARIVHTNLAKLAFIPVVTTEASTVNFMTVLLITCPYQLETCTHCVQCDFTGVHTCST